NKLQYYPWIPRRCFIPVSPGLSCPDIIVSSNWKMCSRKVGSQALDIPDQLVCLIYYSASNFTGAACTAVRGHPSDIRIPWGAISNRRSSCVQRKQGKLKHSTS